MAGPDRSNPSELGRRRKGFVGEAERNNGVAGAQRFDRDDFMELEERSQGHRGRRNCDLPTIHAFAGAQLTAGVLVDDAGMDLHRIGLRGDTHKGQTADQGYCQPHMSNLILAPPLSNGVKGKGGLGLARLVEFLSFFSF